MVPDGRGAQSTGCPVTWLLCLLFLYSQWIRAGLRLPIFFLLCTSTLVSRKKKKSPFFFFFLIVNLLKGYCVQNVMLYEEM